MREHTVYDPCETCLTFGVVVRTAFAGKTMTLKSQPCPRCEGLGFLRATGRTELEPCLDEEDDDGR